MKLNKRMLAVLGGLPVVVAFVIGSVPPASAAAAVRPAVGVSVYNTKLCGTNQWVRVKLPASEYTVHDSGGVCISAEKYHLDFGVDSNDGPDWSYPNINAGYEQGNPSCASVKDTCYRFPVQEASDGTPVASVKAWLAKGSYNLSFDVWFSSSKNELSYQDTTGDTEVMVWLAHPGIPVSCSHPTVIDHISWCVGGGKVTERGKTWNRITYVASRTALGSLSVSNLWLNPFFRDAIARHLLTPTKWLYAIDLGFELCKHSGVGNNIHYYTLADVN